jgi:hypothetical protein
MKISTIDQGTRIINELHWVISLGKQDSSAPRHFGTKKVRYQDKLAPHFLSNKRDYLL